MNKDILRDDLSNSLDAREYFTDASSWWWMSRQKIKFESWFFRKAIFNYKATYHKLLIFAVPLHGFANNGLINFIMSTEFGLEFTFIVSSD